MSTKKATKRALLTSILAICLCLVMLIGSTFAWFTDTASTGVNKIVSGNLDVDIIGANDENHVEKLNFKNATGAEGEALLWEPGCRYLTVGFRIANKGNLALKWKAEINKDSITNGKVEGSTIAKDGKSLLDVIDFYVVTSTDENAEAVAIENFVGNLTKGAKSDVYYIKGVMQTTAGNDYQDLTLDGITITVIATQDTVENDSFNNTYDEKATYPVADAADLKTALTTGGIVSVAKDNTVAIAPEIADKTVSTLVVQNTITKDTTMNLEGKIGIDPAAATEDFGKASALLMAVTEGATLTINGDGELNCEAGENQVYGINVNGGKVVINGGKYYGALTAVQVQKGNLEINGGFFDMAPTCKAQVPHYAKYMVNCIDAAYKDGTATISIKGGTFVNFDPSANPEGAGTSYVADGYKVVSESHGTDTWYTVVAE